MNCVIYISLVLSMITPWSNVQAKCCGHGYCQVNKNNEPYGGFCCGCGSCNIFCCNCGNGCNWGYAYEKFRDEDELHDYHEYLIWQGVETIESNCGHKKREIMATTYQNDSLDADKLFKSIDINGNNAINIKEAAAYLKNSTVSKRSASFSLGHELSRMDTNNDGIISPDEFDESLKL